MNAFTANALSFTITLSCLYEATLTSFIIRSSSLAPLGLLLKRIPSTIPSLIQLCASLPHLNVRPIIYRIFFFRVFINVQSFSIVFKMSSYVILKVRLILRTFIQHHMNRASDISFSFSSINHVTHPYNVTPQTYVFIIFLFSTNIYDLY